MAKAKDAVTTTAANALFKIEFGAPPPEVTRTKGGAASPVTEFMKTMPYPDGAKIANFFVPATAPDTIPAGTERDKALNEEARKITNRIGGISKRLAKEKDGNGKSFAFALRKENAPLVGVRVYRIEAVAAPVTPPPVPTA